MKILKIAGYTLATLLALGILALVIAHGYDKDTELQSGTHSISTAQARTQENFLARLVFDQPDQGGCSVHDAWLEKGTAWRVHSWYGFHLKTEEIPMTMMYIVQNIPADPLNAGSLYFNEDNPAAILVGATSQPFYGDDGRYWMFASNTVFPPPATLNFRCGEKAFSARVEGTAAKSH